MAWTLNLLVVCMLVGASGCSALNDHHYEKTQRARAREAWRHHGAKCHNQLCERDYAAGWKDGFYDVATGGKGCPPVVAPCKYWAPSQILDDCDSRRLAYYDGFQDGVACSLQYPQTHYLKLWSSCECPLPACENRCAPCAPCAPCTSSLPEPCGVVYEGAEFLIEDSKHSVAPIPASEPTLAPVQQAEPVSVPKAEKSQDAVKPSGEPPTSGEPSTSVRFSEPVQLDDYGLATPAVGRAGYAIKL